MIILEFVPTLSITMYYTIPCKSGTLGRSLQNCLFAGVFELKWSLQGSCAMSDVSSTELCTASDSDAPSWTRSSQTTLLSAEVGGFKLAQFRLGVQNHPVNI